MIDYHKLIQFLDEYISHYHELFKFESEKLKMIFADDIDELTKSINKEQALIMKTNVFENKRLDLLNGENENKTFKEIINEAPMEFRPQLKSRYNELSKVIFQIKKSNENAQEIVSRRLSRMNSVRNSLSSDTYNKSGTRTHEQIKTSLLNKDI